MWSRKRIEISWLQLIRGIFSCIGGPGRKAILRSVDAVWGQEVHVGVTERSCFDQFLTCLDLPLGSEVLVSCINIPHMNELLIRRGLKPVPVAIDQDSMEVDIEHAHRCVSASTRAVLFAHLFGARSDLTSLVEFCHQHNLQLWEDCAQAFDGQYRGHPEAFASFFSFGPIKSYTALGGGILVCKDLPLLSQVRELADKLPRQPHRRYLLRILKYSAARLVSHPLLFAVLVKLSTLPREAFDEWLSNCFRNTSKRSFYSSIRQQPCTGLLRVLLHRLHTVDPQFRKRQQLGQLLAAHLGRHRVLGHRAQEHGYWVVPYLAKNRDELLDHLVSLGFDATARCQLSDSLASERLGSQSILEAIVFLPCYGEMPVGEVRRLVRVIREFEAHAESNPGVFTELLHEV